LFVPSDATGAKSLTIKSANDRTSSQKNLQVSIQEKCTLNSQCGENRICVSGSCQPLFDVSIIRVDSPVRPGESLDFKYFVWNKVGDSDDYTITYSLGNLVAGTQVVYINSGEQKTLDSSLNIPTGATDGFYVLTVTVTKGNYIAAATQNVEILKNAPVVVDLLISKLEVLETGTVLFAFDTSANTDNDVLVSIEEKITKDSNIVWQKTGNVQVLKTESMQESVPDLADGTYQLSIKAIYEGKESSIIRTFKIKAAASGPFGSFTAFGDLVPILSVVALIIIVAALFVMMRKVAKRGLPKMPHIQIRNKEPKQEKQPVGKEPAKEKTEPENKDYVIEEEPVKEESEQEEADQAEEQDEKEQDESGQEESDQEESKQAEKPSEKKQLTEDEIENPLLFETKKKKKKKE